MGIEVWSKRSTVTLIREHRVGGGRVDLTEIKGAKDEYEQCTA